MRSRLAYIRERADKLKVDSEGTEAQPAVSELAYLVGYLALILSKHLETGER